MALSLGAKSVILDSTTQCPDWSVKFDVKIDGVQLKNKNTWSNVLGFKTDTRYGSAGYRQPQVFVRDEIVRGEIEEAVLGFRTSLGSYASFGSGYMDFVVTKNEWHSIEIKQKNRIFYVFIDGVGKYKRLNFRAQQYDNVSGFVCMEDKYDCGVGEYRNLEIDFGSCTQPTTPATTQTTTPATTKTTTTVKPKEPEYPAPIITTHHVVQYNPLFQLSSMFAPVQTSVQEPDEGSGEAPQPQEPQKPKMKVTCMMDDLVHMTASVPVDDVQMNLAKMQWALDSVNKVYTKSWTAADFDQQSEMSVDKNNNLILTKRVHADCKNVKVDGVTVCVATGHTLNFQCKYPLGTRTVKNTFDVSGHNADVDAEGVGELKYTLSVADNNVDIGEKVAVTVTPLNKNLVYAQLNDCNVTYKNQSVSILDFKDGLLQPVCAIGAHVGTGHGKSDLKFDWQAFKWATANKDADKELQTISCNIALSKNAPVTEFGVCPQKRMFF